MKPSQTNRSEIWFQFIWDNLILLLVSSSDSEFKVVHSIKGSAQDWHIYTKVFAESKVQACTRRINPSILSTVF